MEINVSRNTLLTCKTSRCDRIIRWNRTNDCLEKQLADLYCFETLSGEGWKRKYLKHLKERLSILNFLNASGTLPVSTTRAVECSPTWISKAARVRSSALLESCRELPKLTSSAKREQREFSARRESSDRLFQNTGHTLELETKAKLQRYFSSFAIQFQ